MSADRGVRLNVRAYERSVLGLALLLGGCRSIASFEPRVLDVQGQGDPEPGAGSPPAPAILSAHAAFADDPGLGGLDGISIVFSEQIDAASLVPAFFSVVLQDGTLVTPKRALLAPADESDENRTVLLVGEFFHVVTPGAASEREADAADEPAVPSDVAVVGRLFSEAGRELEGLAAAIEAFVTPGRMVSAESLAASERACPGAAQVVRTYWVDPLRGVAIEDLGAIAIALEGGRTVAPVGFDDHDPGHEDGQDNVLDLCLSATEAVRAVRIADGVFLDVAGHASAGGEIAVEAHTSPFVRAPPPECRGSSRCGAIGGRSPHRNHRSAAR